MKLIFTSNIGKLLTKEGAINLVVSLNATNANSEMKCKGFLNRYQRLN